MGKQPCPHRTLNAQAGSRRAICDHRTTTTTAAMNAARLSDLVQRRFTAYGLNRLRFSDITFVATGLRFAYFAFVTNAFSCKIVS